MLLYTLKILKLYLLNKSLLVNSQAVSINGTVRLGEFCEKERQSQTHKSDADEDVLLRRGTKAHG